MAPLCSTRIISSQVISVEEMIDSGYQASEHIEEAFSPHAGDSGFEGKEGFSLYLCTDFFLLLRVQ